MAGQNRIPNQRDGIALALYPYRDGNKQEIPKGYEPIELTYKNAEEPFPFPKHWNEQLSPSGKLENRFEVLVNRDKRHIVVTIEGSVLPKHFASDLIDAGATIYKELEPQLDAVIERLRQDFPEYNIVASGHSLGGGVGQSMALKHNLDSQVVDSLPISRKLFEDGTLTQAHLDRYLAAGHRADAIATSMDVATFYYDTNRALRGTYLWKEVGEPATQLPGTDMPNALRWATAPVTLPAMALEHMGGAAHNATVGLSLNPDTGKFIVPENPMAFASIPLPMREQMSVMSPSPVVRAQAGDNAFTVYRQDGSHQWIGTAQSPGQVIAEYDHAQGHARLEVDTSAASYGIVTITQFDDTNRKLSTAVRMPHQEGGYNETLTHHVEGRVERQYVERGQLASGQSIDVPPAQRPQPSVPAPNEDLSRHQPTPTPGGMSFAEADRRRDEPEDTPARSLQPVGRPNVPDPLHDLQLLRDVQIANARTVAELGPKPLYEPPPEPRRKPNLHRAQEHEQELAPTQTREPAQERASREREQDLAVQQVALPPERGMRPEQEQVQPETAAPTPERSAPMAAPQAKPMERQGVVPPLAPQPNTVAPQIPVPEPAPGHRPMVHTMTPSTAHASTPPATPTASSAPSVAKANDASDQQAQLEQMQRQIEALYAKLARSDQEHRHQEQQNQDQREREQQDRDQREREQRDREQREQEQKAKDPREPGHPDHAMYQSMHEQMRDLYARHGIPLNEQQLARTTAALMAEARDTYMTYSTMVGFSENYETGQPDPSRVIVYQGDPKNPANDIASVDVAQAQATSVEQSYQRFEQATQRMEQQNQMMEQQRQQWAQEAQQSQGRGPHL